MHWLPLGIAALLALAIIVIGLQYLTVPLTAARSFGLPFPEGGPNVPWWLRLKGVRDISSGLVVLAMMISATPREVGLVLLVEAFIALGDMSVILAAKGNTKLALGMHGVTAAVMVATAAALLLGVA
ncbi:DUF4267 domain-containing protein [Pleomorphomonas oryzae]|uniref:DUF4267 domain-containing protein n=1 Tax=Pleomorphomonas oryzae TaxID=261934 RepID=UPI00040DFDE4|nr:DUF4267 domain-containing protein [Pleomorphomonas oryzae]